MFWVLVTLFSHVALHFVKRNTFNFYYIIFSKNYLCIHFKNSLQNSHVPDRVILWQIHFAKWKFLKMPQTAIICQLVANSGCVVWGQINTCNCPCNFVYSKLVNCNQYLICLIALFLGKQLSNSHLTRTFSAFQPMRRQNDCGRASSPACRAVCATWTLGDFSVGVQSILQLNLNYRSKNMRLEMKFESKMIKIIKKNLKNFYGTKSFQ